MRDLPRTTRRSLLLGAGATLGLAACSSSSSGPSQQPSTSTGTTPGATPSVPSPTGEHHVGDVYVAHRGGGLDWPEMTVYAYQQAMQLSGLDGMEVSVHRSRDGVLVCNHDVDMLRTTGSPLVIAKTDWAELSKLKVSAKDTLDRGQPSRPVARFEEVLEMWPKSLPMWVEPKSLDAVDPLMAAISRRKDIGVVWKRPVNRDFTPARRRGWNTFGYVLEGDQQLQLLTDRAPLEDLDYVGVQAESSDERVRKVVDFVTGYGRTVVMWELRRTAQRDRALQLGCHGLMCSDIKGLLPA